jgi:hypothetical protein
MARSARRRATDAEQGPAEDLVAGCPGPLWTPEDIAPLGTVPDEEVARRTGRTAGAVRQKRQGLGIPNPTGNRWPAEHVALLGTLPDWEVARRVGRSLRAVLQERLKLCIRNRFDRRRVYDQ